jgi:hypothetical protein
MHAFGTAAKQKTGRAHSSAARTISDRRKDRKKFRHALHEA